MKKIIQIIWAVMLITILVYFIFSFIIMDMDASNWREGQRTILVVLWLTSVFVAAFVAGISGYFED